MSGNININSLSEAEVFFKVFEKVVSLFLLGLIGFLAGKFQMVPKKTGVYLSAVVVKITAPILVFLTMVNRKVTLETFSIGFKIFIFGMIFILFAYCVAFVFCKFINIEVQRSNLLKIHMMFGNIVYMSFPLLISIIGKDNLIYAIFFNLASDVLLWTLGVYLFNSHNGTSFKQNLNKIINSNTVAFLSGFIIMIILYFVGDITTIFPSIAYPLNFLGQTFQDLGNTTIYLSMVFIGLILSEIDFGGIKGIFCKKHELVYSGLKLLVIPLIAVGVFHILGDLVEPIVAKVVVLQLAMPAATIVSALAAEYKSDYNFASQCVFYSTILSLITIPFINYLL